MSSGEVMFLAATAWVMGAGKGGGEIFFTLKQKLPFLDLNQNRIDQLHDSIE